MLYSAKQLALAYPIRSKNSFQEFIFTNKILQSGLINILNDPSLNYEKKSQIIRNFLEKIISSKLINLLILLIKEKAINEFDDILESYKKILAENKLVYQAEIITKDFLDKARLAAIEERLEEAMKTPIILENQTDTSIIGGVIIKINDQTIDNSINKRLQVLN